MRLFLRHSPPDEGVAVLRADLAPGDGAVGREELVRRIMQACESELASFKVPRAVYFVDAFPTGTLDKILKNKLSEYVRLALKLGLLKE